MMSRRTALQVSAALLGAVRPEARAAAQQKVSQTDAKYQDHPNGQQRCGICLQFRPPTSCNLVQGEISPQGWCQFFAARENAR
jgi:hypothetical protein